MSDVEPNANGEAEPENPAAEYVLGLLDRDARREAEARVASDPDFAREVSFWEARFAPLGNAVAPASPSPHVWYQLEARIASLGRTPLRTRPERAWDRVPFWRGLAFGSLALAAASVAGIAVLATRPAQPPLVARLDQAQDGSAFVTRLERGGAVLVIPTRAHDLGAHSAELWLIPPGGGQPQSLGLLDPSRPVTLQIPARLLPHARTDAVLAVSLEPVGGSTTGAPTGPVIAQGKLTSL